MVMSCGRVKNSERGAHCLGPALKGRKRFAPPTALVLHASSPAPALLLPDLAGDSAVSASAGRGLDAASSAPGSAHRSCIVQGYTVKDLEGF